MPREKEGFREQLARLTEQFPGVEMIPLAKACEVAGCSRKSLLHDATFPRKLLGGKYKVPLVGLARWLCTSTETRISRYVR